MGQDIRELRSIGLKGSGVSVIDFAGAVGAVHPGSRVRTGVPERPCHPARPRLAARRFLVIATELVDVHNGWRLWGGQYNRKLSEILAVEEEMARQICDNLRLRLRGEDQAGSPAGLPRVRMHTRITSRGRPSC